MINLTRRKWLQASGLASLAGSVLAGTRLAGQSGSAAHPLSHHNHAMGTVGRVQPGGLDTARFLRGWNFSHLPAEERAKVYRETPRPDGTLLLRLSIAGEGDLLRWIMGYGSHVEVLAPPHLRERVAEEARKMEAIYRQQ